MCALSPTEVMETVLIIRFTMLMDGFAREVHRDPGCLLRDSLILFVLPLRFESNLSAQHPKMHPFAFP